MVLTDTSRAQKTLVSPLIVVFLLSLAVEAVTHETAVYKSV